jgi:hypothetical protein
MFAALLKWEETQHPRDAKGQFVTFYHGTRARDVPSIVREGLKPGAAGLVWATESRADAQRFAEGLNYPEPTPDATVVEIRVPKGSFFFEKPLTPGRKDPPGTRTVRFPKAIPPEYVVKFDPAQPRGTGGRWVKVGEQIANLKAKYPAVAKNYPRDTHTEMGSIESHTKDVGREWEKQLTHEELVGISLRFGSDVEKLMASAIALHDIGKAEAIEEGEGKHAQHQHTIPILQDVLRKEGFSEKDVMLATELMNHDLIGPLFRGYEGFKAKEANVVAELKDKAKAVGMDVADFVTLQLAFYQADASAYPYITQYMRQEPSGKWTFAGNKKIAAIEALQVKKIDLTFVNVLLWDEALHPRDAGGKFSETRGDRSPHEQKRRDFMAIAKRHEREHVILDRMRAQMAAKWKVWSEDLAKGRKKPLKPEGAAAKKLPSYKEAKALEEAFHARYQVATQKQRKLEAEAKEILKVPVADRSDVEFVDDKQMPITIPLRKKHAQQILAKLRQFDGSGALVSSKFTAEQVERIKGLGQAYSDVFLSSLKENPDGSFSLPSTLRLSEAPSPRAFADGMGIYLGSGRELENTVNHEVAHHIELRSGAARVAAIEVREKLANQPREVYKLKTVSPALDDTEEAVRGKFPDPYSAKLYPGDQATEMISTGVESYLADPLTFARTRPEHFNLIFDIMQGKYR